METYDKATEKSNPKKKITFKRILLYFWNTIKYYAQIREDTDYEATVQGISKSVTFRGVNFWVLVFAIIVASVGLNVNSTAVIIGAMLISPLMGPICGLGLAVGTLDEDLLRKSLVNLSVMIIISLVTSFLYFLISPLSDAQSELLARTRPTIFDVFIAFFGGLAGIVATSRKSQSITIISGVAIATALMPPLCTAGFGLATAQFKYFFGAIYLFFINSFFIALATFLMVRYLHFPQKTFMDAKREANVKRLITLFTIIMVVPSIFMSIDVVRETAFVSQSKKFVNDIQDSEMMESTQIINSDRQYKAKKQTLTLSMVGAPISSEDIAKMQQLLVTKYGLKRTNLVIKQTGETIDMDRQREAMEDLIAKKDAAILAKDSVIMQLQGQIGQLGMGEEPATQLAKEVFAQYPGIKQFSYTSMEKYDAKTMEHKNIPVAYIQWSDNADHSAEEQKLIKWLKVRLNIEQVKIIHE